MVAAVGMTVALPGRSSDEVPRWVARVTTERDTRSNCTGAFIGERSVLTAWHCVEGARRVHVSVDGEIATEGVTWRRVRGDVAVVETVSGYTPMPLGMLADGAVAAHGWGGGGRTCRGRAAHASGENVVWCSMSPGSSGGPVVQRGRIVGVVVRGGAQHIEFEVVEPEVLEP